ncbi:MAG: hypothetical protein KZQ77_19285 [Candidatus Thiodiazotropha sp. (ex Notomyrtea botanica)]|nr:hypothetical protein [Candidatus Thiodiazotropha sp. (ex Notomyrtea botanica)]
MSTQLPITTCCLLSLILLNACNREVSESTPNNSSTFSSDEQEVIHQLQEVIRYEDAQESLRQQRMRELSLPLDRSATPES